MGGKSNAPPAPDYYGLAQQQGQISSNLVQQQTAANRPDTTTPFGSTTWDYNPQTKQWTGNQTFNPLLTGTLNTQEQTGLNQAQTEQQKADVAQNLLNSNISAGTFNPVDYSGAQKVQSGDYYNPQAQSAVWDQFQRMQKPLQDQQMEQQESQLQAQGLRPGDAAYDNAIRNLQNTQYNQQQSAMDQSVLAGEQEAQAMQGMDLTAHNSYINDMNSAKNQNLNMFNSMMGAPQTNFGSTNIGSSNAGLAQTPNLLGAQNDLYNSELNQTNASNASNSNMWGGLLSAAAMAAMFFA